MFTKFSICILYATEYGYDLNNNVNKVVNKAGTKTLTTLYTYLKDNYNTQVTLPSSKTISYTYDSLARLGNYQFNTTTPFKVAYSIIRSIASNLNANAFRKFLAKF